MVENLSIDSSRITKLLGTVGSPLIVISELIKNAVDASSTVIEVCYDRKNSEIMVLDNGLGITIEEIKNLSLPGVSLKKRDEYVRNENGFFFTGSKGLGFLSCFSLCDKISIESCFDKHRKVIANLSCDGVLNYELVEGEAFDELGTKVTLLNVPQEKFDFLNSASEIKKLRHISTYLYKKEKVCFPKIILKIDGNPPASIFLDVEFSNMLYDINFTYNRCQKKLYYKCFSDRFKNINNTQVEISEFDIGNLEKVALEHYDISKCFSTRTNDVADEQLYVDVDRVPSFEGRILVYKNNDAGELLKEYGQGVNIYINEFALYNYLNEDNDWLGLADFSQRKKATNLKPHNVFGYVNFPEFNENFEELNISNERADFIQDLVFNKLMYLLKGTIMFLTFNIDVAEKNPKYKVNRENINNTVIGGQINSFRRKETRKPIFISDKNIAEDRQNASEEKDTTVDAPKPSEYASNEAGTYCFLKEGYGSEDTNVCIPDKNVKIKKITKDNFGFTIQQNKLIENIKDIDSLSNKIVHLAYEMSNLDEDKFYCSVAAIYRSLLECATRYYFQGHTKLSFKEGDLSININNVINVFSNTKGKDKLAKQWKEVINKRYLIDILNSYMHKGDDVDLHFLIQTWKSMREYIINCIS